MRIAPGTAVTKLFVTGALLGPFVDSLHNQCLLRYLKAPIAVESPEFISTAASPLLHDHYLFYSSWAVPPLLGVAYIVLGGLLPRLARNFLPDCPRSKSASTTTVSDLQRRAVVAVITTGLIVKLSQLLQTQSIDSSLLPFLEPLRDSFSVSQQHILVLFLAALTQWICLDGTLTSLLVASIAVVGGPLSELPFIAYGLWEYLPEAADYHPLQDLWTDPTGPGSKSNNLFLFLGTWLTGLLGNDYGQLALSSITGPCYFAVTMDAIALGRWFEASSRSEP